MVLERIVRFSFDSPVGVEVLAPERKIINFLTQPMNHRGVCRSSYCVPVQISC